MQGIVGTMPWVAMGFSTLYLQLLGFSDLNSAILVAVFSFGCSLGSFGGGYIGEALVQCRASRPKLQHAFAFHPCSHKTGAPDVR